MKTWKQVGGTWRGYGNGYKAVIYGNDDLVEARIYKGDKFITSVSRMNVEAAKRWAENHYLKVKRTK